MDRPVRRNKKIVDYSQFGDLENDDEDFASIPAPLNKKSKKELNDTKREKKENQKRPQKEVTSLQTKTSGKRIALDDKLYKRDLEVALALSVKQQSAEVFEVQDSQEQGIKKCAAPELENADSSLVLSNCSVDSVVLDAGMQRRAVSKVISQQKLQTNDSDDGASADDYEPASISDEESESCSDFSEDDEEDFAVKKKKKIKEKIRKETKVKVQTDREKKLPKSRVNSTVSASRVVHTKSEPTLKKIPGSSEPVGQPLHTSSPSTDKKPKWTPPAASGSSNNTLKGVSVKSPTQGLRLGLSRLARVKPLHPSAASS
ncbi:RAD51-associated protein 1 isoform X1 [Alligator mississippiensis]|uniref:RAD51-associated protein 1 n=1 Tax=Alligator mississippiensis TaxID=8496 RepID=A0A151P7G2_ALLMI|nr:RAD51-associated protein 1 isoform X1 [Alligator mississippiensis]KYO44695.1 RAD51-associated protein 1 [Alligator mississippiensis]